MPENKPKHRMIKTSIDLTTDQYHFLKLKALERKIRGEDPSFVTILRELVEENKVSFLQKSESKTEPVLILKTPEKKPKQKMIKTSIDLAADQYHFLKLKALERKIRGEDPSFVTILRELIEEDRKKWEEKQKTA
jgi:DNA-directed RNA polymerase subunit L